MGSEYNQNQSSRVKRNKEKELEEFAKVICCELLKREKTVRLLSWKAGN